MGLKSSYNSVIIAEYRLLYALIQKEEYRKDARISKDIFVDEVAKSVYEAIDKLDKQGIKITPASLLQSGSNIDFNINEKVVQAIFSADTEVPEKLDDIIEILHTESIKNSMLSRVDKLKARLTLPGDFEGDQTLKELYELEEIVTKSSQTDSPLLSYKELTNLYVKELNQRKKGKKYSYGDALLDEYFFTGAAPGCITIIGASTNMGKSTYVLSLMDNLLEANSPCLYLSLEMGTISTMDRLVSKRCGIENSELYNVESIDSIIDRVEEEAQNLGERKNFYFCRATGVDINKLRTLIKNFKQRSKSDYCLVAIDLLSSMKGFMNAGSGTSTATSIEINMNKLEDLAVEENVHIIGVVQFNRDSDNAKIHAVDEIEMLRPSLSSIKNSNAYAEKATTVLSLFRPKYYADRYCADDPITETMDDILDVQVLKARDTPAGAVFKYMFDGKHFKFLPLVDEELEKMNNLKNLDIDY